MELYRSLQEVPVLEGRAVALGTFDGVHLGHRQVIRTAIEDAREQGLISCAVTFEPHPAQVLTPDRVPPLLSSFAVKALRIEALGVDELLAIPFTKAFSEMHAEQFCEQVLVEALCARSVSVGANFHFGYKALGDTDLLLDRDDFETDVVGLVEFDGQPVSSTRIRSLLEAGEIERCNDLLGAPFMFEGEIVPGDRRGRELGVPTANIVPPAQLAVPGVGVYAARGSIDGEHWAAAVNVGVRPTFEPDGRLLIEAHLIDGGGDLYGKNLRLAFLERLRDERRFPDVDALVSQMHNDIERAARVAHRVQIS